MKVSEEGIKHLQSKPFRTALADAVWKQIYVNRVSREQLSKDWPKSLAGELLLFSNPRGRAQPMPDLEPIYQEHKNLLDGIVDEALEFADAIQKSISTGV